MSNSALKDVQGEAKRFVRPVTKKELCCSREFMCYYSTLSDRPSLTLNSFLSSGTLIFNRDLDSRTLKRRQEQPLENGKWPGIVSIELPRQVFHY